MKLKVGKLEEKCKEELEMLVRDKSYVF